MRSGVRWGRYCLFLLTLTGTAQAVIEADTPACPPHAERASVPKSLALPGAQINLRTTQAIDAEELFQHFRDERTMEFLLFRRVPDLEEMHRRVGNWIAAQQAGDGLDFVIVESGSNQILGSCGLAIDWSKRSAEFGIVLHHPYWGGRRSFEAMRLVFEYAFETLGLEEIVLETRPENFRMRGALEEMGVPQRNAYRRTEATGDVSFVDFVVTRAMWPAVKEKLRVD